MIHVIVVIDPENCTDAELTSYHKMAFHEELRTGERQTEVEEAAWARLSFGDVESGYVVRTQYVKRSEDSEQNAKWQADGNLCHARMKEYVFYKWREGLPVIYAREAVLEKVWTRAWETGHSNGFYEVYLVGKDLLDFLSEVRHLILD